MGTKQLTPCDCGNDFFTITHRGEAECTNCLESRPYTPKTPRPENGTTKSQRKAINKIQEYLGSRHERLELNGEHLDWGPMSVTGYGHSGPFRTHYHFMLSRRGKVEVLDASGVATPDTHKAHVARMIGGHVKTY